MNYLLYLALSIKLLGNDSWEVREETTKYLKEAPYPICRVLLASLEKETDPEIRWRIIDICKERLDDVSNILWEQVGNDIYDSFK